MIEQTLYRIVFNGETVPGLTAQEIIESFAKRFHVREEKTRELILAGRRTVLKRNLDELKAQRYSSALRKVGLLVVLEPQNPARFGNNLSVELSPSIDITQSELASSFYDSPPQSPRPPAPSVTPVSAAAPRLQPESAPASQPVGFSIMEDWEPCPKCGEPAISPLTGVCQDCGLVVERYLARRADPAEDPGKAKSRWFGKDKGPARAENPYAPPAADLTPIDTRGLSGEALYPPRRVSASRGWGWIGEGWALFKAHPWAWIGAVLLYFLITLVLSAVPLGLGSFISIVLGPILTGGLMIGANQQYRGGGFAVRALFAGLQHNPGPLAAVGLAYLGFSVLIVLIAAFGVFGALLAVDPLILAELKSGAPDLERLGPLVLLPVLVIMLLGVPLVMATYFAPALVALNEVPVMRALKLSFQGCWRNILPFLVFGLVGTLLAVASLLTLGLAFLVLVPVLIGATYMAYRNIYYR